MPNVRLSMRKTKEVLRLHAECRLSGRAIARALGISPSTVVEYLGRARVANLTWPLPDGLGACRELEHDRPSVDHGFPGSPGSSLKRNPRVIRP